MSNTKSPENKFGFGAPISFDFSNDRNKDKESDIKSPTDVFTEYIDKLSDELKEDK